MSNAIPFAVNTLQVTNVSPSSGEPGTVVTIIGNGFGTSQGNGVVWLGSTSGEVIGWSNTQVVAVVASNAVTGVARVEQNEGWSNSVDFSVPGGGGGPSVTLLPNLLNLDIGQTHAVQALDSNGQQVTGLNWTSSNPNVVSLSTNDPPTLMAQAQGQATISTGSASTVVTVVPPGTVPSPGTVLWSDPLNGGVLSLVPVVPSVSGVADVFALDGNCNVWAVASDGTTPWETNIGQPPPYSSLIPNPCNAYVPDFQGGMVVKSETSTTDAGGVTTFQYQLQKFDGMTGLGYPASSSTSTEWVTLNPPVPGWPPGQYGFFVPPFVVHTNGTIFSLAGDNNDPSLNLGGTVLLINPLTGKGIGSVEAGPPPTQQNGQVHLCGSGPLAGPVYCINSQYVYFGGFGNLIVAGDGYAYVPYSYRSITWPPVCIPNPLFPGSCTPAPPCAGNSAFSGTDYLNLLRIDTAGNASSIPLGSWNTSGDCYAGIYPAPTNAYVITNADQGTLVTWQLDTTTQGSAGQSKQSTYYVATTSGTSATSPKTLPKQITPVLQAQDGTFYGTDANGNMVKFDQSGNLKWSIPGDSPQIATPDGGVIDIAGTAWDRNGNGIAVVALPVQSWTGLAYTSPLKQIADVTNPAATPPFWSFGNNYLGTSNSGANQSGNSTSPLCDDDRDNLVKQYGQRSVGNSYFNSMRPNYPRFTPSCFLFASASSQSAHSQYFKFTEINTPEYGTPPDSPDYALIKKPVVAPTSSGYGLDLWRQTFNAPRTIQSGYRDPHQDTNNNSRHMLGDAIDLRNESCNGYTSATCTDSVPGAYDEWQQMVDAAGGQIVIGSSGQSNPSAPVTLTQTGGNADWIEPQVLKTSKGCGLRCTHADWRYHDYGNYAH